MKKDLRKQDIETNKLLLVFGVTFLGIVVTMYLEKMSNYANTFVLANNIINILSIAIVAILVLSGAMYFMGTRAKKVSNNAYFNPKNLFIISIVASICVLFISMSSIFSATKYIYVFLTCVAILYFMLVTYSKEVFLIALSNLFTIAMTYFVSTFNSSTAKIVLSVGAVVVLAVLMSMVAKAKTQKGKVFKGLSLDKHTNYKFLNTNFLVLMALVVVSFGLTFVGFNFGFAICAVYLAIIIFYNTIKIL